MDPLADQLVLTEGGLGVRVLRSEHCIPVALDDLPTRKRKQLTPQQLEERLKKVCPDSCGDIYTRLCFIWRLVLQREQARAKKLKLMEEAEKEKQEERARKR